MQRCKLTSQYCFQPWPFKIPDLLTTKSEISQHHYRRMTNRRIMAPRFISYESQQYSKTSETDGSWRLSGLITKMPTTKQTTPLFTMTLNRSRWMYGIVHSKELLRAICSRVVRCSEASIAVASMYLWGFLWLHWPHYCSVYPIIWCRVGHDTIMTPGGEGEGRENMRLQWWTWLQVEYLRSFWFCFGYLFS